jgi:hypothetical protein
MKNNYIFLCTIWCTKMVTSSITLDLQFKNPFSEKIKMARTEGISVEPSRIEISGTGVSKLNRDSGYTECQV